MALSLLLWLRYLATPAALKYCFGCTPAGMLCLCLRLRLCLWLCVRVHVHVCVHASIHAPSCNEPGTLPGKCDWAIVSQLLLINKLLLLVHFCMLPWLLLRFEMHLVMDSRLKSCSHSRV